MTATTTGQAATPAPEVNASPAFPPEHYGCPPWCAINGDRGGHDDADGLPGRPNFDGYYHRVGLDVACGGEERGRSLSFHLSLGPGMDAPVVSVSLDGENWTDLTLGEAQELAEAVDDAAASAQGHWPPWCAMPHDEPDDDGWHNASSSVAYGSSPKWTDISSGQDGSNPYCIDLVQDAPRIVLCNGINQGRANTPELTLAGAGKAAAAIRELVGAALEGRAISGEIAESA